MKENTPEKEAVMLLRRLRELDEWQAETERRVRAEQERERRKVRNSALLENNNDTEDDTVSSMEYDDNHHPQHQSEQVVPVTEDQLNLMYLRSNLHLQKAELDNEEVPTSAPPATERKPRPFLKRGAGLARFNLPTDLEKQPNRVKKKQPKVRNVATKYTEETRAFSARKAEIRKSRENLNIETSKTTIFRPRSTRNVRNVTKVSPVLKQIINKRKEETPQSSCDSVEHSFKEKLSLQSRRQDKEEKELEVFEMLEGATLNSSFSSTNSNINKLMEKSILPSPSKAKLSEKQYKPEKLKQQHPEDNSTNPSLGETLLLDIEQFLNKSSDLQRHSSSQQSETSTFESESDTSTIIDEDPTVPEHPDADVIDDESSEEVVCVRNPLDYNPAYYNQQSKSGDDEESDNSDIHHQISVLKIRIHELEAEIEKYKQETERVKCLNDEINQEKKSLELSLDNYNKEMTMKMEELKRERDLVRSSQVKKVSLGKAGGCGDCGDHRRKITELEEAVRERDLRYRDCLSQVTGQLSAARRENLQLKNANHRLKIKFATSKVGDMLRLRPSRSQSNPSLAETDSFQSRERKLTQCRVEAEKREEESRRMPESEMKNREEGEERTRRMFDFSSAESLESSLSLVSGALSASSQEVTEVIVDPERGTREKRYQDGRLEIWYSNGNRKEISSDGKTVKVYYYNGDLKEVDGSGVTRYFYHKTHTCHTKHTDGRETTVFSNGQTEEKFPDGRQIISFSDGTRKVISANGEEKISFPDNTLVIKDTRGERVVRRPQSDNIKRNVRKSLKTTLETRIERNSSSKVSLPPQPQQRDVVVL